MATFYTQSEYCIAYLNDVSLVSSYSEIKTSLKASEWFTRGWTLQELLFSFEILFCCKTWDVLGQGRPLEKTDPLITEITGIPRECLKTPAAARRRSVAQRLSWAASRQTTRVEDEAYCLLGLLDVNMPLLYGEGSRAFTRLQEEVIRRSDDETIFAWRTPGIAWWGSGLGILARGHCYFKDCGDLVSQRFSKRKPYRITNRGLEFDASSLKFKLPLPPSEHARKYREIYVIQLNCYSRQENTPEGQSACLLALQKEDNVYYRVRVEHTTEQLWASLVRGAARILTMKPRTFHIATKEADTFGERLSSNQNALKIVSLGDRWRGMCEQPAPFRIHKISTYGTSESGSEDRSGMGDRYLVQSTTEEMTLMAERDFS